MKTAMRFSKSNLLVVLGCVGVLLVTVGAAGRLGRARTKAIVCKASLNRIWTGFEMFYEEHGNFPLESTYMNYWTELIDEYVDPAKPYNCDLWCPSDKMPFAFYEQDSHLPYEDRKKITYLSNSWAGLALRKYERSPDLVILADGKTNHVWHYDHVNYRKSPGSSSSGGCQLNFVHHNDSVNLLFYDGHVEQHAKEYVRWQWFNPGTEPEYPWYGETWDVPNI